MKLKYLTTLYRDLGRQALLTLPVLVFQLTLQS